MLPEWMALKMARGHRDGARAQRDTCERHRRPVRHFHVSSSVSIMYAHNIGSANHRVWISSDNVKAVAEKGFKLIHSASDFFYLDCGAGGWVGANPTG